MKKSELEMIQKRMAELTDTPPQSQEEVESRLVEIASLRKKITDAIAELKKRDVIPL